MQGTEVIGRTTMSPDDLPFGVQEAVAVIAIERLGKFHRSRGRLSGAVVNLDGASAACCRGIVT